MCGLKMQLRVLALLAVNQGLEFLYLHEGPIDVPLASELVEGQGFDS